MNQQNKWVQTGQKYCHEGTNRNGAFSHGLGWLSQLLPLNPSPARGAQVGCPGAAEARLPVGGRGPEGKEPASSGCRECGKRPRAQPGPSWGRVVRACGRIPVGFPVTAHGPWLTCEQSSVQAEAWTLPQHIPGITPTAVNSDSPRSVSQAANPCPAFLSSLYVCLCKMTEERVISELSEVPLGAFQEYKPIFHRSHKWLFAPFLQSRVSQECGPQTTCV